MKLIVRFGNEQAAIGDLINMAADPEVIIAVESKKPDLNRLSAVEIMGYSDISYGYMHWNPLTDMNQCMMVVERMREEGWYLYCEPEPNLTFPGREKGIIIYEIGFYHPERQKTKTKPSRGYCMSERIISESILIAALKAKAIIS